LLSLHKLLHCNAFVHLALRRLLARGKQVHLGMHATDATLPVTAKAMPSSVQAFLDQANAFIQACDQAFDAVQDALYALDSYDWEPASDHAAVMSLRADLFGAAVFGPSSTR
jgi:hypothetical protein